MAFDVDTEALVVYVPGALCPFQDGDTLAAHNGSGFDRFAIARLWPDLRVTHVDTSELARTAGLPGALDALAKRWCGLEKDQTGSAFTRSLSRPSRAKARLGRLPDITPAVSDRVVVYCASDVAVMVEGWPRLAPWLDLEPTVVAADRAINDRGVGFDVALAEALLAADTANADAAVQAYADAIGGTPDEVYADARSPARFAAITGTENAQAETVAACAHPLARVREALASIASGKLRAGLARVSPDGRLRDAHRYYGASTGRWAGRGFQTQNLPRPAPRYETHTDADICALADAVIAGAPCSQDEVDLLLRACLAARPNHTLVTADYAGIEARVLAWASGDADALQAYADGVDLYRRMAGVIFGVDAADVTKTQRTIGKAVELGAGFGMGAKRFHDMHGPALEAAGITAQDTINAWRIAHAPIVRFWRELQDAFMSAIRGVDGQAGPYRCARDGDDVAIVLPSGRPVVYSDARIGRDDEGHPRIAFQGTKGHEHTYGGKLVENAIQATARDLLADTLVRFAGTVVMHVHDEVVLEVPEADAPAALATLLAAMANPPAWARGAPITAEGHIGRRYRK